MKKTINELYGSWNSSVKRESKTRNSCVKRKLKRETSREQMRSFDEGSKKKKSAKDGKTGNESGTDESFDE